MVRERRTRKDGRRPVCLGPTELGDVYKELGRAFVPLVRDYTSEGATRLLEALRRCREAVGDHEPLSLILGTMLDTDSGLAEEFSEREDALDPAIPLVWFQGCYWTVHLGEPFVFVHDDSKTVERWKDDLVIAQHSADGQDARRRANKLEYPWLRDAGSGEAAEHLFRGISPRCPPANC